MSKPLDFSRVGAVSDSVAREQEQAVARVYAGSDTPRVDGNCGPVINAIGERLEAIPASLGLELEQESVRLRMANSAGYRLSAYLLSLPVHEIKRVDYVVRQSILDAVYRWQTEVDAALLSTADNGRADK